ncbi:MAG: hypothetical protein P8170_02465 [Gemmatimonadota bacterium]|jgi:hypothetical protein
MTTRQSDRAIKQSFRPLLEANGFDLEKVEGVRATRERGRYHDQVTVLVIWTVPRVVRVFVRVRSDSLNEFMVGLWPEWGLDHPNGALNLGTFEPGADPFHADGARWGWDFDGPEPPEALLEEIKPLLDSTCTHLRSVCNADTHADLIREHAFNLGPLRPAPVLAGALAHAGRYHEAVRICRAALGSNEAALAESVSYAPQARPLLQAILDYCEARF